MTHRKPRFIASPSIRFSGESFVKSCTWATVHHSRDEDKLQRIIQILEVQRIQSVETVQAQISNLRLRDREIDGPVREMADGYRRTFRLMDEFLSKRN